MTEVELGPYRLGIATDFGPRVVGLRREDGPEVFARLGPGYKIDHPVGTYHFHGGHRLWAAPENVGVTYASEDHECSVRVSDDGVTVTGPTDSAGIAKEIRIAIAGEDLRVTHTLFGVGQLAAWAITQLPMGGVALLTLSDEETAPLPNRQIVLWPYTSVGDHRLGIGNRAISVEARDGPALKVGAGPGPGRLGYLRHGQLFLKTTASASGGAVPDLGAAAQIYVGQGFCELETVGGLGDSKATLTELWTVVPCDDRDHAERIVTEGVSA